jgi:hypothetical protein
MRAREIELVLLALACMLGAAACKNDKNEAETEDKINDKPSDTSPEGCPCEDGETREGATECGLNGNGHLMQVCSDCEWLDDPDDCVDPDECEDGDTREGEECGEVCEDGQWEVDEESCEVDTGTGEPDTGTGEPNTGTGEPDTGTGEPDTGAGDEPDTGRVDGCYEGDFSIIQPSDLDVIAPYSCITGTLYVVSPDIEDVALPNLEEIGDDLTIRGCASLVNLDGLSILTSLGGDLVIDTNENLVDLSGLSGLTAVGELTLRGCASLVNLNGLSSLASLRGILIIDTNENLVDLSGLSGLTTVGALSIIGNPALASLQGLGRIHEVRGPITIEENQTLTEIVMPELLVMGSVGGGSSFTFRYNVGTKVISFPYLERVAGNSWIGIFDNENLVSLFLGLVSDPTPELDIVNNRNLPSCQICEALTQWSDPPRCIYADYNGADTCGSRELFSCSKYGAEYEPCK